MTTTANELVIEVLQEFLARAKQGKMTTLAIIGTAWDGPVSSSWIANTLGEHTLLAAYAAKLVTIITLQMDAFSSSPPGYYTPSASEPGPQIHGVKNIS